MSRANFGPRGLDIGSGNRGLVYLYGLSDFWSVMFEDSEKIELLLEASSVKMADIYSKFLQLTSSLSLADIEVTSRQQIKLYILSETDLVQGSANTYSLTEKILSSNFITNRPFLPTTTLSAEAGYHINDSGTEITFYKPVSELGFPARVTTGGVKQYSFWLVDSAIDEGFIYAHYGKLLQVTPETSTENYKNFIYGLFYLFANGPTMSLMSKGLNLVLGIPLARETESVIDIRKYLDTDQYLVITDANQYLVPYGLQPSVSIGDTLVLGQEIAQWIELKDWIEDGDWWINLQIPATLMPYIPSGETDRYAKSGSYADYLMRNFLKKHTFLVNVKTIDFKNIQTFEKLWSIITDVKPTHTYPIYIWTVPTGDEVMDLADANLSLRWDQFKCDNLSAPIAKMRRFPVALATISAGNYAASITATGNTVSYTMAGSAGVCRGDAALSQTDPSYFEVEILAVPASPDVRLRVGVGTLSQTLTSELGETSNSYCLMVDSTNTPYKRHNGVSSSYGLPLAEGDIIGVVLDSGSLEFYINGISQGVAYSGLSGSLYPMVSFYNNSGTSVDFNFGERAWAYEPPFDAAYPGVVHTYITPLTRGCPQFTRYSVRPEIADLMGANPAINGLPRIYEGEMITKLVNYVAAFRGNTPEEAAWVKSFLHHDHDVYRAPRTTVDLSRDMMVWGNAGVSVRSNSLPRVVPLYATTQDDLITKFASVGSVPPGLDTWSFTLFQTQQADAGINVTAINQSQVYSSYDIMLAAYYTLFFRGTNIYYLGNFMPYESYKTFAPPIDQLREGDYLLFQRIQEKTVAAYWVTTNQEYDVQPFFQITNNENLALSVDSMPITRGMGVYSAYYYLRGSGVQFLPGQSSSINGVGINHDLGSTGLVEAKVFTDIYNPTPIIMDRSGKSINVRRDMR